MGRDRRRAGQEEAGWGGKWDAGGQAVAVHDDDKNPEHSAIVTDIKWHYYVLPIVALVVLLLAARAKAVADAKRERQ